MKHILSTLAMVSMAMVSYATSIDVNTIRTAGPFKVQQPLLIDSLDANQKKFSTDGLLDLPLSLDMAKNGLEMNLNGPSARSAVGMAQPSNTQTTDAQIMLAYFSFTTTSYVQTEVKVKGPKKFKVYINGKEHSGKKGLQPGSYDAVVKYVADTTSLILSLDVDNEKAVTLTDTQDPSATTQRPFTLGDNMHMKHYNAVKVSPSGKYAIVGNTWFNSEGKTVNKTYIIETATGKQIRELSAMVSWMPKTDRYYLKQRYFDKLRLVAIDPITLDVQVLCSDIPKDGEIRISPTETYAIISKNVDGPKKESGVYEIINPDDRQPGWRNRGTLSKLDFMTGLLQPLTFSNKNIWLLDFAANGRDIIFAAQIQDLTQRPSERMTVYRMNTETLEAETLIEKQGFLNDGVVIPGTELMAVVGSAEAFDGIGRNLPDSLTPNIYEHQMFLFNLKTKQAEPMTCDFIPSIESIVAKTSSYVYFTAEAADSVPLYRLDVKTKKITKIEQPMEVIGRFSLSDNGQTMLCYGTSACTPARLYNINLKTLKPQLIGDLNKERMEEIALGTCEGWRFKSKNGYELTGHVYLPANMDKSKQYPMIVHYYGGCSPTSRRFGGGSHYPAHYWNALGYVVLVVNPSGAAGFGQEWGARHVNTAGEGVAEDIIEATEWYADNNSFVNKKKIGCVSASYGGFMTQLLLEKTDLFACGISHAGISDHTSYWGEGYWGYSYSEVSMANSYPWNRPDLYVDRSTLFHADKVKAPLLFTHGTADTNVPIGESIQMYTALKLLGIPTAFIMVEGENHGIMDYSKRQKWINTMMAWFQKYLQDDDSWWKAMYKPKEL